MLIALSGVDGSGKSTFSRALMEAAPSDRSVVVVGLRFDPRLVLSGKDQPAASNVRTDFNRHPAKTLLLRVAGRSGYARVAAVAYRRQLLLQLAAVRSYDIVIADRFVLDFVVDLIASSARIDDVAHLASEGFPAPDRAFMLDVPDDVLLQRAGQKQDDPGLVLERARLYRDAADRLGVEAIDSRSFSQASMRAVLGSVHE